MRKWRFYYTGSKRWDAFFKRRNFYFTPTIAVDYDWFKIRCWYFGWLSWLIVYAPNGLIEYPKTEQPNEQHN